MHLGKKMAAEALGTFWLILAGTGSAVLAASFPELGIGFIGVALAFGLSVLTGAYALGHISGAHFNPAVTIGLAAARRIPAREILPYIAAQAIGAVAGSAVVACIASGKPGFDLVASGFAANGYGEHSPGQYTMLAGFLAEAVLTFAFLIVILNVTAKRNEPTSPSLAPVAIGLTLTLINLVAIPVTNASFNPIRSTAPALFVGGWAIEQLWLFWVAPIVGALLAAVIYPLMVDRSELVPA